jgi:hypothetical protein
MKNFFPSNVNSPVPPPPCALTRLPKISRQNNRQNLFAPAQKIVNISLSARIPLIGGKNSPKSPLPQPAKQAAKSGGQKPSVQFRIPSHRPILASGFWLLVHIFLHHE